MHFFSLFTFMTLVHVLIIIGISIRVIQVRPDLRLHRKIVVIDDTAGNTGNFNLVDLQTWQRRPGKERFIENLAPIGRPS